MNKTTTQVMDSIQNFYESFCRSSSIHNQEFNALHSTSNDDDIDNIKEKETSLLKDSTLEAINMEDIETHDDHNDQSSLNVPFVAAMAALKQNPLDFKSQTWPPIISFNDAKQAIECLTAKRFLKITKFFYTIYFHIRISTQKANSASFTFSVEDSNPTSKNPEIDTQLDQPTG